MTEPKLLPGVCPTHGVPRHRESCSDCNAAYMRQYLRRRRIKQPEWALWQSARKRAARLQVEFDLPLEAIVMPDRCPALGISLVAGGKRSANSPSLDRIDPTKGYIVGNCRVISDHANRLKGRQDLAALRRQAEAAPLHLRTDYERICEYVEREALLIKVRSKAALGGDAGVAWSKVATFLDHRFARGLIR